MKIGTFVTTSPFNYKGMIVKTYATCPQGSYWLSKQDYLTQADKKAGVMWVDILVHGGGMICSPVTRVKKSAPFVLVNTYLPKYPKLRQTVESLN